MANNNEDPTWILLIILGTVLFLGWLIWFFFQAEILSVIRYVRFAELSLVGLFDPAAKACANWVWQAPIGNAVPSDAAILAAAQCFGTETLVKMPVKEAMDYYTLTATSLGVVTRVAMSYVKWIILLIACVGSYKALFVSKRDSFKTRHNLESFIRTQAKMWPVIEPMVNFNPSKHSARIPGSAIPQKLPLFAEALSPEEWLSFQGIPVVGGIPDRDRTRRAFLNQLGPKWRGRVEDLPPYLLGLFAAFALKGVQKRDESDDFLGRLSTCWSAEKGFKPTAEIMAEIKKIARDPAIGGKALEIASQHAYRTTAFLGILRWARFMGGVLAAAQFLWLRGVDRELWYALNNLGRRSFHSEGAGAMAHYLAEDAARKALPVPRLETAIIAMNQYLAANQPTIPPREEPGQAKLLSKG